MLVMQNFKLIIAFTVTNICKFTEYARKIKKYRYFLANIYTENF